MDRYPPPRRTGSRRASPGRLTGLLALIGVLLLGGACLVYGLSQSRSAPDRDGADGPAPVAQDQTGPTGTPDLNRPTARIAADGAGAELREDPSAESPVLETLPTGTEVVEVASVQADDGTIWHWVLSPSGESGWLPEDRLIPLDTGTVEPTPPADPGQAGGGVTGEAESEAPTATPSVSPTPTAGAGPPAPTATAATRRPPPASAPAEAGQAAERSPAATVERFYALVEAHDFAAAAELWSPRLRATYPPAEYIDARFARVQQLVVERLEVVALDQANGRAEVAVQLLERPGPAGGAQRWAGSWHLVRGPNGWLLDQPALRPA